MTSGIAHDSGPPAGRATAVAVSGLRRRLGVNEVLRGVDLRVDVGEVLTLVGPSGCGKSTLLRAIAGLEKVDEGRVEIDGRDVTAVPPEKRRTGLVFQDNALFGHLRVEANVAFGLRHLSRGERRERVAEVLATVRLGHLARRYPHQISGGEQQRVALARALAPQPSVVLLDEPFASLDEVLREELGWEIREILASHNTAAVLVTHDRHEALTLGDRVAVMNDGAIAQCDAPRAIYRFPATRFVAGFVAVASYLPEHGDRPLRPHELRVTVGGDSTVVRVEFVGSTFRYTVRMPNGNLVVADSGPDTVLKVGERCSVALAAS